MYLDNWKGRKGGVGEVVYYLLNLCVKVGKEDGEGAGGAIILNFLCNYF